MGLLMTSKMAQTPKYYNRKRAAERKAGRALSNEEFERDYLGNGGGEAG